LPAVRRKSPCRLAFTAPRRLKGEMRTFECEHRGKEMKMIVEETEPQETGAI
jgi:hypothetical protein